ncbi:protein NYNRIN-like [Pimephales promelas]|nr:protein NYNRIN-like [Pimephales promelas]
MDLYAYGGREFVIIVDHYSDYWEIDQLPDLTADTVITRCKVQFARYGQPDQVITDNGPQFACEQFRKFAAHWEFRHVTSSPQHPKSNVKAESSVKIVKSLCKRAKLDEGLDSSPAQRLMSCRLRSGLPMTNSLLFPKVVEGVSEKLRWKRRMAKFHYDARAKDLPELNVGEHIRMKPLPGERTGRWRRGQCLGKVNPRSYVVDVDGTLYRRNRVDLRRAERSAQFNHQEAGISQGSVASNDETAIREGDTSDSTEYVPEEVQEQSCQ